METFTDATGKNALICRRASFFPVGQRQPAVADDSTRGGIPRRGFRLPRSFANLQRTRCGYTDPKQGPLAQLVRALARQARGQQFDPVRAYQFYNRRVLFLYRTDKIGPDAFRY